MLNHAGGTDIKLPVVAMDVGYITLKSKKCF